MIIDLIIADLGSMAAPVEIEPSDILDPFFSTHEQ
jgi:hypothetical protein